MTRSETRNLAFELLYSLQVQRAKEEEIEEQINLFIEAKEEEIEEQIKLLIDEKREEFEKQTNLLIDPKNVFEEQTKLLIDEKKEEFEEQINLLTKKKREEFDETAKKYIKNVVKGINNNNNEILETISKNLKEKWDISRISKINLSLLKLATYEIIYVKLPYKVVINEVVELAKKYGDHNSPSFINGILANIVKQNS